MSLVLEFEKTGNWLFKHRSYLPLILYIIVVPVLFVESDEFWSFQNPYWWVVCLVISFLGLFVRAITIGYAPQGTSGRNTGKQVADEINTKGIYSVVRHPLYLGNFLIWLGLIMYVGSVEFLIFSVFLFWIYYERIMFAEEQFIRKKFGEAYDLWAAKTPAFFPKLSEWVSANLSFSFKNVIKREYHGFFAIILSFTIIHILKHLFYYNNVNIDFTWRIIFFSGAFIYIVIRILVKTTTIFDVKGR